MFQITVGILILALGKSTAFIHLYVLRLVSITLQLLEVSGHKILKYISHNIL